MKITRRKSIYSLLIIMACTVALARLYERANRQRLAVAAIERLGGSVEYGRAIVPYAERFFGLDFVASAKEVTFNREFGQFKLDYDLSITHLERLPRLKRVLVWEINGGSNISPLKKTLPGIEIIVQPGDEWYENAETHEPHGSLLTVAFSPQGEIRAMYGQRYPPREWDGSPFPYWKTSWIVFGDRLITCPGVEARDAVFSKNCKLVSASIGQRITVWDVVKGERVSNIALPSQPLCQAFSPDGKILATGHYHTEIRLSNVSTGTEVKTLVGAEHDVCCVAFSPSGDEIAAGGVYGAIDIWNMESFKKTRTLHGHKEKVSALAFSPDGKTLATASYDDSVRLWDMSSGTTVTTIPRWGPGPISFHPQGKLIAIGGHDIDIWDVKSGKRHVELKPGGVQHMAFSPDGKALACGYGGGPFRIRLWKLEKGSWKSTDLK